MVSVCVLTQSIPCVFNSNVSDVGEMYIIL